MNGGVLLDTLIWGFVATICLSTVLGAAQGLRYTRLSLPLILGTIFHGSFDRANRIGYGLYFLLGWVQAYVYLLIFASAGAANWYGGALLGLVHGLFLATVALPLAPSIHPRMASESRQPQPTLLLEPPGAFGLHYGTATPLTIVVAHVLYGAVLGAGLGAGLGLG